MVHLVATDAREVEALKVKEHTLNHLLGVIHGCEVTWTKSAVHFDEGFVCTLGWVFFERRVEEVDVTGIDVFKELLDARVAWVAKRTE